MMKDMIVTKKPFFIVSQKKHTIQSIKLVLEPFNYLPYILKQFQTTFTINKNSIHVNKKVDRSEITPNVANH